VRPSDIVVRVPNPLLILQILNGYVTVHYGRVANLECLSRIMIIKFLTDLKNFLPMTKNFHHTQQYGLGIRDPEKTSLIPYPDPDIKKAPVPGSGTLTMRYGIFSPFTARARFIFLNDIRSVVVPVPVPVLDPYPDY
jgi:hypothetical protein